MYNIDLYHYDKEPYIENRKFSIHPLDDEGKEKYYSNQSHNVHYFKRTDPFVFKSILGVDYDTLVRQQKEDISAMNNVNQPIPNLEKKEEIPKINENTINQNFNADNNNMQIGKHLNQYEESKNLPNKNDINSYNYKNSNHVPLKFRKAISSSNMRPYIKYKDFKDIYGYDNVSTFKSNGEKYLYAINKMKKVPYNKINNRNRKKYDGFTAYDVPVIEPKKPPSSLFQNYNEQIGHTLKCINNSSGIRKAMNNDEMRNNLFNQTSRGFLKINHLPDIIKIADSRQVIRKQRMGLSKEMGEKYNPYSLIAPSKNRTGRNYIGDLFKH